MSVTFRGTAVGWVALGNNATVQNIFALVNQKYSRVNVHVKHLQINNDAVGLQTVVHPVIKASRITGAVTGGSCVVKVPFDTTHTSSPKVMVFSQNSTSSIITATASSTLWEQYVTRSHTAAEQRLVYPTQGFLLSEQIARSPHSVIVRPGEALLVQAVGPAASSNTHDNHNWMVQISWEEVALSTFAISGVVSLSGSPVNGAKVSVLESTTLDFDDAEVVDIRTTNALGEWSSTIVQGRYGKAIAQYRVGSTYYTSVGRPYLGA